MTWETDKTREIIPSLSSDNQNPNKQDDLRMLRNVELKKKTHTCAQDERQIREVERDMAESELTPSGHPSATPLPGACDRGSKGQRKGRPIGVAERTPQRASDEMAAKTRTRHPLLPLPPGGNSQAATREKRTERKRIGGPILCRFHPSPSLCSARRAGQISGMAHPLAIIHTFQ